MPYLVIGGGSAGSGILKVLDGGVYYDRSTIVGGREVQRIIGGNPSEDAIMTLLFDGSVYGARGLTSKGGSWTGEMPLNATYPIKGGTFVATDGKRYYYIGGEAVGRLYYFDVVGGAGGVIIADLGHDVEAIALYDPVGLRLCYAIQGLYVRRINLSPVSDETIITDSAIIGKPLACTMCNDRVVIGTDQGELLQVFPAVPSYNTITAPTGLTRVGQIAYDPTNDLIVLVGLAGASNPRIWTAPRTGLPSPTWTDRGNPLGTGVNILTLCVGVPPALQGIWIGGENGAFMVSYDYSTWEDRSADLAFGTTPVKAIAFQPYP